jgi:predicted acylesterase/phospholipase RssA/CRP-like cAMP-binding protein
VDEATGQGVGAEWLDGLSSLEVLSEVGRAAVVAHAQIVSFAADDLLPTPEEGEVLALLDGRLAVALPQHPAPIAVLEPGEIFSASLLRVEHLDLHPLTAGRLARLPASGVEELLETEPAGVALLARRVGDAERRIQLAIQLSRLFPGLDLAALEEFGAEVEWVSLRAGDWLFREGDAGDSAYVVISGRLRAVRERSGEERLLNEIGQGETVGEMALLSDASRSASVYAVRDTQLAKLGVKAFETLTERHPVALRRIAGFVVERLRRHGGEGNARPRGGIVLAVLGAHPGIDLTGFAHRLAASLATLGSVEHVDRSRVDAALGRRGSADAADPDPAGMRLVRWLNERDALSDFVLYQADSTWSPWTHRVARHADRVLMVASADAGPALAPLEERCEALWRNTRGADPTLILIHAPGTQPKATAEWLSQRSVRQHFHVREGVIADVERVARSVTGRGIGLVLGGGGARGFAHLGVLQACEEAGVPIDFVGGTSIGSIISALPAQGLDAKQARDRCRQYISSLYDPTLPLVSILAGRRIGQRLAAVLGDFAIEDLWLPYFCVATNLSRAEAVLHRSGPLFRAVRSSISLPGILPPVTVGGEIHVDGGLLNNLPIDVMQGLSSGPVLAVDVSPDVDLRTSGDLASELSGWRALWQRLRPFGPRVDLPYISSVLMRSALVASIVSVRERRAAEGASLYLKLPVDAWGLLEFEKLDAIADRGYSASAEPVRAWWAAQQASGSPR